MRYRSFLLVLFLLFAAPGHAAQASEPVAPHGTAVSPAPIPHQKPSKAKPKSDAKAQTIHASPTPEAKLNVRNLGTVGTLAGLLFFIPLYFLPWIVAASRRHRNRTAIAVANFFLGWTCAGWVAILIWASTADVEPRGQAAVK